MNNTDHSIPIHPDRALDPHLCVCPHCGKENGEIAVGHTFVGKTPTGQKVYFARGRRRRVETELRVQLMDVREVREHEKIPGSPCDECREAMNAERALFSEAMRQGGVAFRCSACGLGGVIRRNEGSEGFCDMVRGAHGMPYNPDGDNEPCGIAFDNCNEHKKFGIGAPAAEKEDY